MLRTCYISYIDENNKGVKMNLFKIETETTSQRQESERDRQRFDYVDLREPTIDGIPFSKYLINNYLSRPSQDDLKLNTQKEEENENK